MMLDFNFDLLAHNTREDNYFTQVTHKHTHTHTHTILGVLSLNLTNHNSEQVAMTLSANLTSERARFKTNLQSPPSH